MSNPYEVQSGSGTGCPGGHPIKITATAAGDAEEIHEISDADAVDKVWVEAYTNNAADDNLNLIISPVTDGILDLNAATVKYIVRGKSRTVLLDGLALRKVTGGPYALAAYTDATGSGKIRITCTVTRLFVEDIA